MTATTTSLPTLVRVEQTPRDLGHVLVSPIWGGVDRPNIGGVVVTSQKIADRLTAAIMAGVVYPARGILTDKQGDTYADYAHNVLGKYMNADLKKLGF